MNYSASGVWMDAIKEYDREQKRLQEFYNDINAKVRVYRREQEKIPKEVLEIDRKIAYLATVSLGSHR